MLATIAATIAATMLAQSAPVASTLVAPPYRVYPFDAVPRHAKACAVGRVVYRRRMADGDWHVTIIDERERKLVLEIVPELPLDVPRTGMRIVACGIGRYDTKHGWGEIHPVVKWQTEEEDA